VIGRGLTATPGKKKRAPGPAFLNGDRFQVLRTCLAAQESKVLRPVNLIVDGLGLSPMRTGIEAHHGAGLR